MAKNRPRFGRPGICRLSCAYTFFLIVTFIQNKALNMSYGKFNFRFLNLDRAGDPPSGQMAG